MEGENNAWNRSLDVPFLCPPAPPPPTTLHCSINSGHANKQPGSMEHLLSWVWVPTGSRYFAMMDELVGGKLPPLNGQGTRLPSQGSLYKGDSCIYALEFYVGWEIPRSQGQTSAHSDSSMSGKHTQWRPHLSPAHRSLPGQHVAS